MNKFKNIMLYIYIMYIYCKSFKNFTLQFKDCCEANVNPHRIKAVPPVYWFWQAFFLNMHAYMLYRF